MYPNSYTDEDIEQLISTTVDYYLAWASISYAQAVEDGYYKINVCIERTNKKWKVFLQEIRKSNTGSTKIQIDNSIFEEESLGLALECLLNWARTTCMRAPPLENNKRKPRKIAPVVKKVWPSIH